MDIWHIIVLALIQGITEFLPISSSAHLILIPHLTGWQDQGFAFDIAVHVGTLTAVLIYFRKDLKPLIHSWLISFKTQTLTSESQLAWGVLVGTIPVAIFGLLMTHFQWQYYLRSPLIIASTTIIFGLLLWWADVTGKRTRHEYTLTWYDIFIIGFAQALALVPGTSRSGITITAALLIGLTRQSAARFSFLLSIPIIILGGMKETIGIIGPSFAADIATLLLGAFFSAISAYLCIYTFIRLLDRIGMFPFVVYRLILGALLFVWFL